MDTKWLLRRLEERGETVASLARAVGRDRAALSRIVNGEQPLQLWMTPIIADKLGVSDAELLRRTGVRIPQMTPVPIVPWHSVGAFTITKARVDVSPEYERIAVPIESETMIAMRVDDNAMSAVFPAGSVVVVDYSQKDLRDAEIGVFITGNRAVLRRFNSQRRKTWLSTDSTSAKEKEEEVGEIVGPVVSAPIISRAA